MAPEQARGERVDARADVFAVGVILWEALTGRPLRARQTEHQILGDLIAKITPPRAATIKPSVSLELDDICARALSPDRSDRYHSAGALQLDLEAYLATLAKPVTTRDLGTVMRELFHDDRSRTQAMIESYVAKARAGGSSEDDDLPIIDVSYSPGDARTPVSSQEMPAQPSSAGFVSHEQPSGISASGISANRPVGTLDHALEALPPAVVSAPNRQYPALPPPPTKRYARWIVMPGVMIGGVLLGGMLYNKLHSSPTPTVTPPPPESMAMTTTPPRLPAITTPAPTPAPVPSNLIEVQVKAVPVAAVIEIDGAQVIGNPFKGRYINDGAMHQVRVSAPGHVAKTTAVSFDAPVALKVELERVAVRPPPARNPPPPHHITPPPEQTVVTPPPAPEVKPPPPKGPIEVDPNGGAKPHRTIDPNNPYAK